MEWRTDIFVDHNLRSFSEIHKHETQEALRIFPMRLWVVGYERPPTAPPSSSVRLSTSSSSDSSSPKDKGKGKARANSPLDGGDESAATGTSGKKDKDKNEYEIPSWRIEDPSTSQAYRLPIIHFEGEVRTPNPDAVNGPGTTTVLRQMKGSVRAIGGGAVRWSMVS
jgi:hypothetical protein